MPAANQFRAVYYTLPPFTLAEDATPHGRTFATFEQADDWLERHVGTFRGAERVTGGHIEEFDAHSGQWYLATDYA